MEMPPRIWLPPLRFSSFSLVQAYIEARRMGWNEWQPFPMNVSHDFQLFPERAIPSSTEHCTLTLLLL